MLAAHELWLKLGIQSCSLISSPQGLPFYKSFGFTEMAHQSLEINIPFKRRLIREKQESFTLNSEGLTAVKRSITPKTDFFRNKKHRGEQNQVEQQTGTHCSKSKA